MNGVVELYTPLSRFDPEQQAALDEACKVADCGAFRAKHIDRDYSGDARKRVDYRVELEEVT